MSALMPLAAPLHAEHSAHLRILEAYVETLKAENESLKRQLAARDRCPWWCRRSAKQSDDENAGAAETAEENVSPIAFLREPTKEFRPAPAAPRSAPPRTTA